MTALQPARSGPSPEPAHDRIPFPVVDEISRHCLREEEPETVHIEVHLPRQPDPDRLRAAFGEALRRHPRILVREAPGPWYRRRYEWELTGTPDADPVGFPEPGPGALERARARALAEAPPLSVPPPVRLEVVSPSSPGSSCVLLLPPTPPALDGPACLRVLATAAELYSGTATSTASPVRDPVGGPGRPEQRQPARTGGPARPARVAPAADVRAAGGNGLLLADLPVPRRPAGARYTVNDQLLVATCLMIARWNRLHDAPPRPMRITMPIDDRPRGAEMPIGNGTRLVEVGFGAQEYAREPGPEAVAALLHRTAERTRALKSAPRPQLGHAAALLTAPALPVGMRAALTRGLRRAAAPWTSTTLLSNIGRIPYPLDFAEAGRAEAVWFSAPASMPRGLTVTTASTGGRLHLALRWSRALLDDAAGQRLCDFFTDCLEAMAALPAISGGDGP
ncbi:condensation protein [Streptomyces lunaelactis]|uniref:condensation protein n=1 Tax=Streptomyces lunaelactis TaxID=1535768 RepID=UPI001585B9AB|nr:condensation protein [Streptomyces lunaelactis]NUK66163.1 condensation protein [Streptomyces lunaelactis]